MRAWSEFPDVPGQGVDLLVELLGGFLGLQPIVGHKVVRREPVQGGRLLRNSWLG